MIYCYEPNILPLRCAWNQFFCYNSAEESIFFFKLFFSRHVVGEDDFLTRAIFDLLHFSPSGFSWFLTRVGGERHVPQQTACQQSGRSLFLGKLCTKPEWPAQGRVSLTVGYNPPRATKEFKGGSEVLEKTLLVSSCWLFPGWKSEAVVSQD